MTIAVDFDGTIVEHRYPEIGPELPFATETLRMLGLLRQNIYKIFIYQLNIHTLFVLFLDEISRLRSR